MKLMRDFSFRANHFVAAGFLLFLAANVSQAATYTNNIAGFAFTPASMTIGAGDTIVWKNLDNLVSHSATGQATNSPAEPMCGAGTFVGPNGFCSHQFNNAGRFGYFCTVHFTSMFGTVIVTNSAPPNNPPSISLTNPAAGTKFVAPATIPLQASASDSDGSVTNVQFFSGATSLGNVTTLPYNLTLNNVAAGNYSFSAIAKDNLGAAKTSLVTNVFVLTNAILTAPSLNASAQFQFKIIGIAGQTYATEASSNGLDWSGIVTNVAPSNIFDVIDPGPTNLELRFYRARQDL